MRYARYLVFILLFSAVALAHNGKPHDLQDLWHSWSFDPLVVIGLAVSALVYCLGLYRLWRAAEVGHGITRWEAVGYAGGWLSLFIALVSPLHPWGEVLFSAHMTQHEVLMLVAAPLLVIGRPFVATVWALPPSWRWTAGAVVKSGPVHSVWRFATNPFAAWAIHAAALWIWHLPLLFQWTLESDFVHTLQHLSFLGSALLFWWAIIASPSGAKSYGAGILYLFTTSIHSGILGAFLTFSHTVLYPAYSSTTQTWGLTPLEDQQVGGLIMWVPAGLVYIVAGLTAFAGWLRESERTVQRREQLWAAGQQ